MVIRDEAWFWTEDWQAGEREADRELAEGGQGRIFTGEEFLEALERGVDNPEALR